MWPTIPNTNWSETVQVNIHLHVRVSIYKGPVRVDGQEEWWLTAPGTFKRLPWNWCLMEREHDGTEFA
jgi:hypothetical protein